jgi:DNA-binding SARP family transcriptional activator
MGRVLKIQSLGVPVLADDTGTPVAAKTRKALAILIFLLRTPGNTIPREALADFFWSDTSRDKATQSLRQALRQLRNIEETAGIRFLQTGNMHVSLDPGGLDWDLVRIWSLIERGKAADFKAAETLWKGEFLYGYEALDPEFNSWLLIERERIRTSLLTDCFKKIDAMAIGEDTENIEAAAKFLLHVDGTLEHAHQVLIRHYLALGQMERARQQLKACERELAIGLDAKPDPATYRLFAETAEPAPMGTGPKQGVFNLSGMLGPTDSGEIRLPEISILSLSLDSGGQMNARMLRDEIVAGLSSYRSFELIQAEYREEDGGGSVTRVESGELGSYLLRFRHDPAASRVYIQFESRDTGRILFNEIIDFDVLSDRNSAHVAAFHTVSRIHTYAVGRLRKAGLSTPFARWCQAESLMWEFSPASDEKALRILNELEKSHSTFSMTYAGKASIDMKRLLYYPKEMADPKRKIEDILSLAERGVLLDPWQPINQRVYGWGLVQSGQAEDAKRAFRHAEQLNLVDPNNLMSVAEGLAFVGDIENARKIAERAFGLFPAVPRIFFEYLANIHFAAEDYLSAAEFIERAPAGSIFGLTTRIAALVCTGRENDAVNVLQTFGSRFGNSIDRDLLGPHDQFPWHQRINFFQDPNTRANYRRGADLVQRFFLGGL